MEIIIADKAKQSLAKIASLLMLLAMTISSEMPDNGNRVRHEASDLCRRVM